MMLAGSVSLLAACTGDRTPRKGKDTINDRYGTAKDSNKMDTAATTAPDNSASGGTTLIKKDSVKKDSGKAAKK